MSGFAALAAKLASLTKIPSEVPEPIALAFNEQLQREFVEEKDPYGRAWKPLAKSTIQRKGHDRIMFESGDMLEQTKAHAVGDRIEFVGTEYGPFHQGASGNRPARPAVPNESALPKDWQEDIRHEFGKAVAEKLK